MSAKVLDELGNSVFSAISTRDPQLAGTDVRSILNTCRIVITMILLFFLEP